METATLIPSKKRKRARSILNNPHLPRELIEEILLHLPHKSLVRFSAVSKLWKSMIFDPEFTRKRKNHAALLRQQRLVVYMNVDLYEAAAFCSLARISSDLRLKVTRKRRRSRFVSVFSDTNRDIAGQFGEKPYLRACCDELWCVQVNTSLFLWNPSIGNMKELPPPSSLSSAVYYNYDRFLYGLAYDSVNDDYKILKIRQHPPLRAELYSLRNNCWKEIKPLSIPHRRGDYFVGRCEFVNGRFHWIRVTDLMLPIIASFDLSTEEYGEIAPPLAEYEDGLNMEVVALRGKLCASLNYRYGSRFVLWVMEESWTKRFDIPLPYQVTHLTPFYLSDNNDVLFESFKSHTDYNMYISMYRNGEEEPEEILTCGNRSLCYEARAFLYVESLINLESFSKNR